MTAAVIAPVDRGGLRRDPGRGRAVRHGAPGGRLSRDDPVRAQLQGAAATRAHQQDGLLAGPVASGRGGEAALALETTVGGIATGVGGPDHCTPRPRHRRRRAAAGILYAMWRDETTYEASAIKSVACAEGLGTSERDRLRAVRARGSPFPPTPHERRLERRTTVPDREQEPSASQCQG